MLSECARIARTDYTKLLARLVRLAYADLLASRQPLTIINMPIPDWKALLEDDHAKTPADLPVRAERPQGSEQL
jgi:hypothetical protein